MIVHLVGLGSSVALLLVTLYDGRQHRKILRTLKELDRR